MMRIQSSTARAVLVRAPKRCLASAPQPIASSSTSSSSPYPIPPSRSTRARTIPRDLPIIRSRTPIYILAATISILSWTLFLSYATNEERSNSSVVRSLLFQLKASPAVKEFLGEGVRHEVGLFGWKRVEGSINMLAGSIDVRFPITGSKDHGHAIFTSVRRGKQGRFEVLRWRITRASDGAVLDLAGGDPRLVTREV